MMERLTSATTTWPETMPGQKTASGVSRPFYRECTWTSGPESGNWTKGTDAFRYDFAADILPQGREYDPETNLYYYRARYYDPTMGRFLQTDPIGYRDSMNLYQALRQNPENYVDPFGRNVQKRKYELINIIANIRANQNKHWGDITRGHRLSIFKNRYSEYSIEQLLDEYTRLTGEEYVDPIESDKGGLSNWISGMKNIVKKIFGYAPEKARKIAKGSITDHLKNKNRINDDNREFEIFDYTERKQLEWAGDVFGDIAEFSTEQLQWLVLFGAVKFQDHHWINQATLKGKMPHEFALLAKSKGIDIRKVVWNISRIPHSGGHTAEYYRNVKELLDAAYKAYEASGRSWSVQKIETVLMDIVGQLKYLYDNGFLKLYK